MFVVEHYENFTFEALFLNNVFIDIITVIQKKVTHKRIKISTKFVYITISYYVLINKMFFKIHNFFHVSLPFLTGRFFPKNENFRALFFVYTNVYISILFLIY